MPIYENRSLTATEDDTGGQADRRNKWTKINRKKKMIYKQINAGFQLENYTWPARL